jgi:5-methyltetrahydropteroyltriglutamate--homocysteine methyltransferase
MVHTTVVGSYPRIGDMPEEQVLRRGIARLDKGEIDESALKSLEREVVQAVLRDQNDAGIEVVTDGQISWYDSQSHLAGKLASVEINGLVRYFDTNTYYRQPVVRGPVTWSGPILLDEWTFAKSHSNAPVKAVLTGPVTLASLALDKHYRSKKALALDLAAALAEEVDALARAGAVHIQIDEPIVTRHPEELALVAETLERIRARKGKANLILFTYFGDVAKIYSDLLDAPADFIGLDLVQGAGTWSALAKHGSEKPLILGLIDARNTKEEDSAAVAKRVGELDGSIDLTASYLSPSNGLEFLPRDRARRKLRILRSVADRVGVGG